MADARKKLFAGKTIAAKIEGEKRGADDPGVQSESFIAFYPQFFENFEDLDASDQRDFRDRGNDVLDDRNVGDVIVEGDGDQVKEEFADMATADLKQVMNFLVDE